MTASGWRYAEEPPMAENIVRGALKQGLKTWIVTRERVSTMVTQLREDIEDVVVEARQEYEGHADTAPKPEATSQPAARRSPSGHAAAPKSKTPPARATRKESAVAASKPARKRVTARVAKANKAAGARASV
jgi:hypothetical protein